jgi:lactate/malate dehydrogenase, NAD binding domain
LWERYYASCVNAALPEKAYSPSGAAWDGVAQGNVGATTAYALLLSGLAAEIVLIDVERSKAEGQAMDLNHAEPFALSSL